MLTHHKSHWYLRKQICRTNIDNSSSTSLHQAFPSVYYYIVLVIIKRNVHPCSRFFTKGVCSVIFWGNQQQPESWLRTFLRGWTVLQQSWQMYEPQTLPKKKGKKIDSKRNPLRSIITKLSWWFSSNFRGSFHFSLSVLAFNILRKLINCLAHKVGLM